MATPDGGTTAGLMLVEQLPSGVVVVLTFDRPHRLNAVDWPLYQRFVSLLEGLSCDKTVPAVIIRGAGRAFCAGGDISFMKQMNEGEIDKAAVQDLQVRFFATLALPQLTIAFVDGPAIGLSCTFALSCDLVFAGEKVVFADPHVQMGLVRGDGGTLLWPLLIGPARAYEFLFTGDTVTATDALSLGLVNHVYPSHEVFDRAVGFAERLARGSLAIIQAIKLLTHQTATALRERFIRAGIAMESISQTCAAHHPPARRAPSTRSRIWAAEYHHDTVRAFLAGDPVVF
jgi:enoyl-CoA hydratase